MTNVFLLRALRWTIDDGINTMFIFPEISCQMWTFLFVFILVITYDVVAFRYRNIRFAENVRYLKFAIINK
jgi:predicted membrane protein